MRRTPIAPWLGHAILLGTIALTLPVVGLPNLPTKPPAPVVTVELFLRALAIAVVLLTLYAVIVNFAVQRLDGRRIATASGWLLLGIVIPVVIRAVSALPWPGATVSPLYAALPVAALAVALLRRWIAVPAAALRDDAAGP
jgi:hypothetical protein